MTSPLEQLHKPVDLLGMPQAEARIELAKDVLAALSFCVFRPKAHSAYFFAAYRPMHHGDLQDAFKNSQVESCEVCGLGALFVAQVGRLDGEPTNTQFGGTHIRRRLGVFFSQEQLTLIECAFEMTEAPSHVLLDQKGRMLLDLQAVDMAVRFGCEHTNDRNRLCAIMQNIIDNGGEFIP